MITFYRELKHVGWDEAVALFKLTLGAREQDKLQRAFENSFATVAAFDDQRLIGMGRAICDGEYQAAIYDVVVHPEYQRRGIGAQLMSHLRQQLPVDNIILYSVPKREGFYAKCGYKKMRTAMAILHPWMDDAVRGYLEPSQAS